MRRTVTVLAATGAAALIATSVSPEALAVVESPAPYAAEVLPTKTQFDLQAHRGGIGMTTEETPEGFAKALRLGVTTLELDTQVTRDRKVVVTHDRQVSANKCRDTAPVTSGDPQFPYVGKFIKDLSLKQVKTLNCGFQQLPGFPEQEVVPGAQLAELKDVFDVVKRYKAWGVTLNIETKVEAAAPEQTAPRTVFVGEVYGEIARSGLSRQVTVQSFDWGALMEMHRLAPRIPLVALTNFDFLQVGQPGASPWLGGIDSDDFGGDFVAAAASIDGVTTLSPNYGFPQNGKIGDPGFRFYADKAMIQRAHARGLKVVPWTCDDMPTVNQLIEWGADGIITDYPNRVRALMSDRGMRLPKAYQSRGR